MGVFAGVCHPELVLHQYTCNYRQSRLALLFKQDCGVLLHSHRPGAELRLLRVQAVYDDCKSSESKSWDHVLDGHAFEPWNVSSIGCLPTFKFCHVLLYVRHVSLP